MAKIIKNIEKYDGTGDVYDFLQEFKNAASLLGITQAEVVAANMEFNIVGESAKQKWRAISDGDKANIEKIYEHVTTQFRKSPDEYLRWCIESKMDACLDPQSYGLMIQKFIKRAAPKIDEETLKVFASFFFKRGIPASLNGIIQANSYKSYLELIMATDNSFKALNAQEAGASCKDEPFDLELNKVMARNQKFEGKRELTCYFCKKPGHKKSRCFEWRRAKGSSNDSQSDRNRSKFDSISSKAISITINSTGLTNKSRLLKVDTEVRLLDSATKALELKMLVDSGATHSFINPKYLSDEIRDELRWRCDEKRCEEFGISFVEGTVNTVNRTEVADIMFVPFKIRIGDWVGEHKFVLSKIVTQDEAILGNDFLIRFNCAILSAESKLSFGLASGKSENERSTSTKQQLETKSVDLTEETEEKLVIYKVAIDTKCKVGKEQTIEPNSEKLIRLETKATNLNATVLFERGNLLPKGTIWSNSVSRLNEDGSIVVSVINTTSQEVKLDKDAVVGEITDVGEADIIDMDEAIEVMDEIGEKDDEGKLDSLNYGDLSDREKGQMKELVKRYLDTFNWNDKSIIKPTPLVEHTIELENEHPIKTKQCRVPHKLRGELDQQVDHMLKKEVIRPSKSPWNSPVILVKKKNGKYRFCVDFRKLNEQTIKDAYPVPFMDETIDAVNGARYFITLDLAYGYWQVGLREGDKEKTAFSVNNEMYEFNVMPFGLCNGPATFQRLMDRLLKGLTWKRCLVYLDDVIIFAKSFEQLLKNLEEVLARIRAANLKLQPEKCVFGAQKVKYLGFVLSSEGLQTDPDKVTAIDTMPTPKTNKEVKRFLGSIGFYRRFVRGYSEIAAPLYPLTAAKTKFKWSQIHEEAFNKLKEELKKAPILKLPDFSKDFVIETDASNQAIGAVLLQESNGLLHPVAYASRPLSKAERNYITMDKELLGVVWASRYFKNYIFGKKIVFFTDHKPLVTMRDLKDKTGRTAKLFFKLECLNYELRYKKGEENVMADFLSRIPSDSGEAEVKAELNALTAIEPSIDWAKEQRKDEDLREIRKFIEADNKNQSDWTRIVKKKSWFRIKKWLRVKDSVLYKVGYEGELLIVVPAHLKAKIFAMYHDLSNHKGAIEKIKRNLFWVEMDTDIKELNESCDVCQRTKVANRITKAPLKPIVVTRPWELIGIDVIGKLPKSSSGNYYIIIAIDYFTKWAEARAIKANDAASAAKFVFESIVCRFGTPEAIVTDQGSNFEAKLFQNLCELMGVKKLRSTSYHHETVGLVERLVRTLKEILRCYINETHTNYDELLSQVIYCYNTTVQASTGFTPYEAVFARKPVNLQEIILNIKQNQSFVNKDDYVRKLIRNSERIQSIVNRELEKSREQQKRNHDKQVVSFKLYDPGDLVLLTNEAGALKRSKKLLPKFIGPFKVVERLNELNYRISFLDNDKLSKIVHYNRLKKYNQRAGSIVRVPKQKTTARAETIRDRYAEFELDSDDDEEEIVVNEDEDESSNNDSNDNNDIPSNQEANEGAQEIIIQPSDQTSQQTGANGQEEEEEDELGSLFNDDDTNEQPQKATLVCPKCQKVYTKQGWFAKHTC